MPAQQGQGLPNTGSVGKVKDHGKDGSTSSLGSAQMIANDRSHSRGEDLGSAGASPAVTSPSFNRGR